MHKPTLTQAQDYAFQLYISDRSKENRILHYLQSHTGWFGEWQPLRELGFDNFVLALYNGYEVEKNLDDLMLEAMEKWLDSHVTYDIIIDTWNSVRSVIQEWEHKHRKDGQLTQKDPNDLIKPN